MPVSAGWEVKLAMTSPNVPCVRSHFTAFKAIVALLNSKCEISQQKLYLLVLSQCKITSAYKEPRSSGNSEVTQIHLAISIFI